MDQDALKQYVAATQAFVADTNAALQQVYGAIKLVASSNAEVSKQTAITSDLVLLALRSVAERDVEFRTMLLRLCHEPASNPAAQEAREALKNALGEVQKILGDRPTLKPVPPAPK